MSERDPASREPEPTQETWYRVLTSFPFLFFPLVASIGLLVSLIMPLLYPP